MMSSLILLAAWAVLATVWVSPTHLGVALSILFEFLLLLSLVYLSQSSHLRLLTLSPLVDKKILKRAWLEAKSSYVEGRNAFSRNELVTFEEYLERRN